MKQTNKKLFFKTAGLKTVLIVTAFLTIKTGLVAHTPTNFHRPYDVDFRLYEWGKSKFRIGAFIEDGKTSTGRDWDSNKVGIFQLYNQTESSLGMLLGVPSGSFLDKLAKSLGVSAATATDNGCRGRFKLDGSYKERNYTFFAHYKLPITLDGIFQLSLFVPIREREFYNVSWCDQTRDVLSADKKFKEQVSGDLETFARNHACLDINQAGWKESGVGDVAVMLGWRKDFKQLKNYLKNVRINARVGVSIPTGKKKDDDQVLSLPLGLDGAWGVPASLGLDLDFIYHLRAGVELSFLGTFDTTRIYRMKTDINQTDFLLLHRGKATKSQGPMWQFILFTQAKKLFFTGLSAMVSYHFVKHDENRLWPKSYDFDHAIVNSAQSLKEWSTHSFVFRGSYAPWGTDTKGKFKPQLSFFYKVPVAGKRAIVASTIGGQIAFSF